MKNYIVLLVFTLTSCAYYQPGVKAKHKSGELIEGLTAAAEVDDSISNKYFKFLNVTFGNKGPGWIRIKSLKLKDPEKEYKGKINLILGSDLKVWAQSTAYVNQIDAYNRSILTGVIASTAIVTGAVAGSKGNMGVAAAGFGVATGAIAIEEVNRTLMVRDDLERGFIFPEGHIYRTFSIPAGLYNKRWILLEFEDGKMPRKLTFEIELLDGRKTTYDFPLKKKSLRITHNRNKKNYNKKVKK